MSTVLGNDGLPPLSMGWEITYRCPSCGLEVEAGTRLRPDRCPSPACARCGASALRALRSAVRMRDGTRYVEQGGCYDARSAAINVWSHHWLNAATGEESEIMGTFYVRWGDTTMLWQIETDEGFSLEDLMGELGRLELQALGYVKHGDIPRQEG